MAYNDEAVIKISTAHFWQAPSGTAAPEDPLNPESPWENIGHTTMENILSMTSEGGETTVLGSLQNRNLRTSRSTKSSTFNFSIHQFDDEGLKLYLGSNSVTDSDGRIGPADSPAPTDTAFYVCIEDGDRYMDFYVPKSDIIGAEDLALADTESLSSLPLAVTPLRHASHQSPYYIGPVQAITGP